MEEEKAAGLRVNRQNSAAFGVDERMPSRATGLLSGTPRCPWRLKH